MNYLERDPRRYGCEKNEFLVKETLTLPEGKTVEEMLPIWEAQGLIERVTPDSRL